LNIFYQKIALRKTILRAHRQAWCWQDEYQGLTLADIRRLEDETQRELNKRMAQFQNENIRLSLANDNLIEANESTNDINQQLSIRRSRQLSFDNMNAGRSRINSFPVPPLPRDETADDEFFDAECKANRYFLSFSNYRKKAVVVCHRYRVRYNKKNPIRRTNDC
jgi:hypothetical protein